MDDLAMERQASPTVRILLDVHGLYAMRLPNGCAVNFLTECQEMSASGCGNSVTTCDTMEDRDGGFLHGPASANALSLLKEMPDAGN